MQSSAVYHRNFPNRGSSNRSAIGTSTLILLIVAGCGDLPDDIVVTQQALTAAYQGMLVPAYIPSNDAAAWNHAMPTATAWSYYVVTGPEGPMGFAQPPFAPDSLLTAHVNSLHSYNAQVLGYVSWKTTYNRTAADIKSDIDRWANNPVNLGFQLDGIFIDDALRNDESILAQIEWLGNYAQSLFNKPCPGGPCPGTPGTVVFNWGVSNPTMEKYVNCQLLRNGYGYYGQNRMHWVNFEGDRYKWLYYTDWFDANHNWVHNYSPIRFVSLIHGASPNEEITGGPGPRFQTMTPYANAWLVYATDADINEPPWTRVAADPLWTREQQTWGGGGQNSFFGKALGWETFAYSIEQCPVPAI